MQEGVDATMNDMDKIPETMEAVEVRVAMMKQVGFPVAVDDVIKEAIKDGLQALLDEQMSGHYYTVHWDVNFKSLEVIGFGDEHVGDIEPEAGQPAWIDQFKTNTDMFWFNLDTAVSQLVGR